MLCLPNSGGGCADSRGSDTDESDDNMPFKL
jgi:hypothetical protein